MNRRNEFGEEEEEEEEVFSSRSSSGSPQNYPHHRRKYHDHYQEEPQEQHQLSKEEIKKGEAIPPISPSSPSPSPPPPPPPPSPPAHQQTTTSLPLKEKRLEDERNRDEWKSRKEKENIGDPENEGSYESEVQRKFSKNASSWPSTPPSKTLYVRFVPRGVSDSEVHDLFKKEGGFVEIRKVRNVMFVEYENVEFASAALKNLQNYKFRNGDRGIVIDFDEKSESSTTKHSIGKKYPHHPQHYHPNEFSHSHYHHRHQQPQHHSHHRHHHQQQQQQHHHRHQYPPYLQSNQHHYRDHPYHNFTQHTYHERDRSHSSKDKSDSKRKYSQVFSDKKSPGNDDEDGRKHKVDNDDGDDNDEDHKKNLAEESWDITGDQQPLNVKRRRLSRDSMDSRESSQENMGRQYYHQESSSTNLNEDPKDDKTHVVDHNEEETSVGKPKDTWKSKSPNSEEYEKDHHYHHQHQHHHKTSHSKKQKERYADEFYHGNKSPNPHYYPKSTREPFDQSLEDAKGRHPSSRYPLNPRMEHPYPISYPYFDAQTPPMRSPYFPSIPGASSTLFVHNLPPDVTTRELSIMFRMIIPTFKDVRIIPKDREHPIAFVDFTDAASASYAMQMLQGFRLDVKSRSGIIIEFDKKKKK